MPSLVHVSTRERFPLERPLTSIGRAAENDMVLHDEGVEPSHAVVHFDGSSFVIQGARRGAQVFVNGKKRRKHTLAHSDQVQLGNTLLTFEMLDTSAIDVDVDRLEFDVRGLRRLHELSEEMFVEYELPNLLERLMDSVIELVGADKGFLILAEEDAFHIKVARRITHETIRDAIDHVSDSIIAKVIQTRKPLIVSDALSHAEFSAAQSVINLQLSSVMCAPLMHKGTLLGVLYLGNESVANLFGREHLELLKVFASQASLILANAMLVNDLRMDNTALSQRLQDMRYGSIIGACDAMRGIFRTIEKVAPTNVTVLVLGETGTGKELIANELHRRSTRASGPFITINCGAIPETLLESELFGHVKGAFTGATSTRQGKFQAADGGTIFLDEIGEMPINLQVKLLRVLQDRTITKVGSTTQESVDIRVVAATNRDLETEVRESRFREDLYYRLNVVPLNLPPLRKRGDDVLLIARFLIQQICDELNMPIKELSAAAQAAVKRHAWPGNIRQLENRLKKALVLSDGVLLTPEDLNLDEGIMEEEEVLPLAEAKERFAYRYIMAALERNDHNRTRTARELGVDPRTIFRYLEKEI